jgi:hypothetical protein
LEGTPSDVFVQTALNSKRWQHTILKISCRLVEVAYSDAAYNLSRIQCAIPVFEGLLPEPHNKFVMELLFTMVHWHGLAKLRMHNDLTLAVMDAETSSLGVKLREFSQKTCPAFATRELRREYNARLRRSTKKSASRYCQTAASDVCASDATNQTPPALRLLQHPLQPGNHKLQVKLQVVHNQKVQGGASKPSTSTHINSTHMAITLLP